MSKLKARYRNSDFHQKASPPFFPLPFDPSINPWVSPGIVPCFPQYFVPYVQAPMPPGTMPNATQFPAMMQQLPVYYAPPQSGVPVTDQVPPMDQHQPTNPTQLDDGLQPTNYQGQVNYRAAPPPAPVLASTVRPKAHRRSRAIPIIDPNTQEDLLTQMYSGSSAKPNHSMILRKEMPKKSSPKYVRHCQRELFDGGRSPASEPSVPPPSIPTMEITTDGTPSVMNGSISEESIIKSTLSINAKPFVFVGASSNRPLPIVEEVHPPVQEHQPTQQVAKVPSKTPEEPIATAEEISTTQPSLVSANADHSPSAEIESQVEKKQPIVHPQAGMKDEDLEMNDNLSDISSTELNLSLIADEPRDNSSDSSNHQLPFIEQVPQPAATEVSSSAPVVVLESTPINPELTVPLETPEVVIDPTEERLELAEKQPVKKKKKTKGMKKLAAIKEQPKEAAVADQKKKANNRKKKKHRMPRVDSEREDSKPPVTLTATAAMLVGPEKKILNIIDSIAVTSLKETSDEQQVDSGQPIPLEQLGTGNNVNETIESTPAVGVDPSPTSSKEHTSVALEQPMKETLRAPVPLATVQESAIDKKPLSLIDYSPDQWSPHNLSGKKKYSFVQLLQLKYSAHSLKAPRNLPKCVVLDRFNRAHIMRSTSYPTEMSLLPNFMRMGNGSNVANQMRSSLQGTRQTGPKVIQIQLNEGELKTCQNAWRPRHLQNRKATDEQESNTQELFKRFRSILNKLTPENFDKLVKQVRTFVIDNDERLNGCIDLVFEKAIAEPTFSETYAKMCKEIGMVAVVGMTSTSNQKPISFKHRLVTRCQMEFERRRNDQTSTTRDVRIKLEANRDLDKEKFEDLRAQLEEEEQKVRRRAVGTIRFIGELYKQGQLTSNIMHTCIKLLLAEDAGGYNEETLECLCKLLTTIGSKIEIDNRQDLNPYFLKMDQIVLLKDQHRISSRICFMIQDVIDLRRNRWKPRRQELKPKTMDEIQDEAQKEQNHNMTNYLPSRGGGGGDMGQRGGSNMQAVSRISTRFNDQGRLRSSDTVVSNSRLQLQIDPKRFSIPSNLDATRLGSAASYQGWNNTSNMFALLNNEGSRSDQDGYRNQNDRYRNENTGYRDSYHKTTPMEPDRYNRYGSSAKLNDERVFRSSREPSSSVRTAQSQNSRHSNDQMHDRIAQPPQSTFHSRSSEQRYIPLSNPSPAGQSGFPPCMPSFAMPKTTAVHQNFPPPDRETETKIQKIAKSITIEMDQSDIEATATMLNDLNIPAEYTHAAVSQLLMDNIERDVKSREMVVQVIAEMFKKKLIVKADYLHALEELFKLADDLIIDLPQLYRYVATFYVKLLNKRFIRLIDVRNAATEILPQHGASMLTELLLQYEATYGKDATVTLWNESSLGPKDFIKLDSADQADKYLSDANLDYLLDSKTDVRVTESLEIKK